MPDQSSSISIPLSEVRKLRAAVTYMDCLSQDGFSEITSIAKLALARLETPEGYNHLEDIANALEAIWYRANDAENLINYEAETVGCNYIDEVKRRRVTAMSQSREGGQS